MYARAVEEAAVRLRELHRDEWERFGLAAAAMALALGAAQAHHPLAMPLFLGSLVVGGLAVRAVWQRWDLVDRLSAEPDAHAIAEVLDYASREATPERRRGYAALIRHRMRDRSAHDPRMARLADELEALARELEDTRLPLDPACAVACRRLLTDPADSALFDPAVPAEDLLASVRRIRFGLNPGPDLRTDEADADLRPQSHAEI
jgi:hypothetical protein